MKTTWRTKAGALPIVSHLPQLVQGIRENPITLLEAPPGSGKTTILPLALLDEPWLAGKRIVVLQPRRVAARSVATRMSQLLSEPVGGTVGYQVRLESQRSRTTRIEVITEGLLTRRLLSDPELRDVGLVIFDEFHERSVQADVSLALTLETASILRPDLKVVVMSATLGESVPPGYFDGVWRYSFEGTPFPVTTIYEPGDSRSSPWERVVASVRSCRERFDGDILAFLPGTFEIQRARESLERLAPESVVLPLFGDLSFDEQMQAIQPDPRGRRKIVLATTIAETSLTIEGVRVVVDSGLHKVSRTNSSGLSSLSTEPITRDAADQRRGRAGRVGPGVCVRLWSELEHQARRPFREPEILRSDLTQILLDLAVWGTIPENFQWVTPPTKTAVEQARQTLITLGALETQGAVTQRGKVLSSFGTHPRLGAIALASRQYGLESLAGALIALLEERDISPLRDSTANILLRLDEILSLASSPRGASRRIAELSARWTKRINELPKSGDPALLLDESEGAGVLIAHAFPEHIARRRESESQRYLLASGRGATLRHGDPLASSPFLAVALVMEGATDDYIRLAAPLDQKILEKHLSHLISHHRESAFDDQTGSLVVRVESRIGSLAISSRTQPASSDDERADAFAAWLASPEGFEKIPFSPGANALRARVAWARAVAPDTSLPDLSREALAAGVREWLLPMLSHPPTLKDLSPSIVDRALETALQWAHRRELDDVAPPAYTLPNGKQRTIHYPEGAPALVEARIQDLFGVRETPRIGRLKIPLTVYLLSPANRPVQVTQDLASFWKSGYPEVRKELRGRYPKHAWPEDPHAPQKK